MVCDFANVYITKAEYESETCPWTNEEYWLENKAKIRIALEQPEFRNPEILLASYGTPSYEGYAYVLFHEGGKLYEVEASHCSCYGVEGQWEPEETTIESLEHRLNGGKLGMEDYQGNMFANELREIVKSLKEQA